MNSDINAFFMQFQSKYMFVHYSNIYSPMFALEDALSPSLPPSHTHTQTPSLPFSGGSRGESSKMCARTVAEMCLQVGVLPDAMQPPNQNAHHLAGRDSNTLRLYLCFRECLPRACVCVCVRARA
jgi:hypothetical protein